MAYKVKFDTGQEVEFQNQPTQQDIEEAFQQIKKPNQPQQSMVGTQPDIGTQALIGAAKSYARPLVSGVQNVAKIIGGTGAFASVPSQERQQKQLTGQYESIIQQALKEKDLAKRQGLLAQARATQGQIGNAGAVTRIAENIYETPSLDKAQEALQYKTAGEKFGGFGGELSQMFLGGGLAKAGTKATGTLATKGTGMIPALTRIGGSLLGAVPGAVGTSGVVLAQQKSPETQQEAISGIKKAGIAGATDLLLAGALQSAKEVFGAGKKALWRSAIPNNQKKDIVRQIAESENKWDNILTGKKPPAKQAGKNTTEYVADWYAKNAPAGSSSDLAGWSKSYMRNVVEPNVQKVIKKASPVKADTKFINTLLDNLEEGYKESLEPDKIKVVQELRNQLNNKIPDIQIGDDLLEKTINGDIIPADLALRLKRLFGNVAYEKGFQQMSKMTPKREAFARMASGLKQELFKDKKVAGLIGIEEKLMDGFGSLTKSLGKEAKPISGLFGFYDTPAIVGTFMTGRPEILLANQFIKPTGKWIKSTGYKTKTANLLGTLGNKIAPESLVGQFIRKSSAKGASQ